MTSLFVFSDAVATFCTLLWTQFSFSLCFESTYVMNLLAENVTICYRICFYPTEASSACSIGIGRAAVGIDIRFHRVVRRVQSRPIILEETRV